MNETQAEIMSFKTDEENYEAMSEPYAGTESASAALESFRDEFFALRKKHRIQTALFVAEVTCNIGDQKKVLRFHGTAGDAMRETELLLWAAKNAHVQALHAVVNQAIQAIEEAAQETEEEIAE